MSHKLGFAILGFGRMGLVHVKTLMASPRANVKWIVRNKLEEAKQFVNSYGLAAGCSSPDNLDPVLNDPDVHAVVICSPTSAHESQITKALQAGKAVFCEKPVTSDRTTTKQLYQLADQQKKPLFCAFNRRFDPSFRETYNCIRSGKFGNLRLLKASSHDVKYSPISYIKTSGGILNDSTIHDLDCSLWMVGSEPDVISVQGSAFNPEIRDCNDHDLVVVTIRYKNGVVSVIDNGRQANFGYVQSLEALCDKGLLVVTDRQLNQFHRYDSNGRRAPDIHTECMTRYAEAYQHEMEHFLDVLQGKSELSITAKDTLSVMALVEAGNKSLKTGKPEQFADYI